MCIQRHSSPSYARTHSIQDSQSRTQQANSQISSTQSLAWVSHLQRQMQLLQTQLASKDEEVRTLRESTERERQRQLQLQSASEAQRSRDAEAEARMRELQALLNEQEREMRSLKEVNGRLSNDARNANAALMMQSQNQNQNQAGRGSYNQQGGRGRRWFAQCWTWRKGFRRRSGAEW